MFFLDLVVYFLVDFVVISVDIDLIKGQEFGVFLDVISYLEEDNDGEGEVRFEEVFGSVVFIIVVGRVDGDVDLGNEYNDGYDEIDLRIVDIKNVFEWDFIKSVILVFLGRVEVDVGEVDGVLGEEGSEIREIEELVEYFGISNSV